MCILQELLGAFLSLSMMPEPGEANQALSQAIATSSAAGTASHTTGTTGKRQKSAPGAGSQQALPMQSVMRIALAKALPGASAEALDDLASAAAPPDQ